MSKLIHNALCVENIDTVRWRPPRTYWHTELDWGMANIYTIHFVKMFWYYRVVMNPAWNCHWIKVQFSKRWTKKEFGRSYIFL